MTEQRAVVVGIDGSPHSELAQRWAVAEALLGSVSQGVLHHATCPVAVVPMGGGDEH